MHGLSHQTKGFTVIELIMVIVILAIVSVYVFPKWPGMTVNLDAQAQLLANDLRYTQSLSMSRDHLYRWVKTSSTAYEIRDQNSTAIMLPSGATSVTFNGDITFGTLTNLSNNLVSFDGQGVPCSDTSDPPTALSSDATIPITSGALTKTITITRKTGKITIS